MGKGARTRQQRAGKAAKRVLNAAIREQDEEVAILVEKFADSTRRQKRVSRESGAALWVLGGTAYLAEEAATRLAPQQGFDEKTAGLAAAYISEGLMETMKAMVVDFDLEHFEEWVRAFTAARG